MYPLSGPQSTREQRLSWLVSAQTPRFAAEWDATQAELDELRSRPSPDAALPDPRSFDPAADCT